MTSSLQEVGLAVKRLQWRHHRAANVRLAELGLSLVQWDVLRHLAAQPEASLHDLAVLTFQTDQSMGALAGRMIKRGLLARVDGPGRAVRHRLTERGDDARRAGSELMDAVLRESFGALTPEQVDQLHELLTLTAGADAP
ncbi:MarR family winged helix-turn-helix transcriptional regulator [Microlunatus antarcticus]|uniref:DNA-binding MarR family transcriptional regulator n=1 Tax=Microlunatus antarcticus TaxID=53388 RepID=A0A7W5JSJ1_9ACTN|nr:MarR family winged helix-turn-helix transcriptional regulator [Microlunatus antarcticus]MBB3325468.1 DNA-binding MarR family transcriptional regulator [Microlunatus antarcticus]